MKEKRESIKLFFWDGMRNFGDLLNPLICEEVFGIKAIQSDINGCEAAFIGSLLDDFLYKGLIPFFKFSEEYKKSTPLKIWGCGFITDKNGYVKRPFGLPEIYFRKAEIYAVRGYNSKKRLEKILNNPLLDCAVGDPGLLADKLIDTKNVEKKYKLGIIPHHLEIHGYGERPNIPKSEIEGIFADNADLDVTLYKDICKTVDNAVIIDMEADPIEILKRISECETILSSALHGLIAADALGIPNLWSRASDMLTGGNYKFHDYYSVFGLKPDCADLRQEEIEKNIPDKIKENYKISRDSVLKIQENLVDKFPYQVNKL